MDTTTTNGMGAVAAWQANGSNWRDNLAGWVGATQEMARRGVEVAEVRRLKTAFVQWEVGGTYRHRALLVCDPESARTALEGVAAERMAPQGGALVRSLFGSTTKSRMGFTITSEGVEIYADQ